MKQYRKSKKGFTLVELIVVLVILAVLAAMLVPALTGYIDRAKKEKDYQAASVVYAAAQAAITEMYGKGDITKTAGSITQTSDSDGIVYNLAGVDSGRVPSFSFTYGDDLVIDFGKVDVSTSGTTTTYYLYNDGSWGPDAWADATTGAKP
ncbi:MAG: type II secretion system protein [Clostridiales bacterium]|nr:type II secretion system protein [Clostridiales bacterium]